MTWFEIHPQEPQVVGAVLNMLSMTETNGE